MSTPNALAVTSVIAMALAAPRSRPYGSDESRPAMRQPLHSTKPFEATADARKRKKAERQRKKQGRKGK